MGKLEKLIDGLIKELNVARRGNKDEANDCFFRHEFYSLREILINVREAYDEFPDYGKLTNLTVSRFEMACQDWFRKWFSK